MSLGMPSCQPVATPSRWYEFLPTTVPVLLRAAVPELPSPWIRRGDLRQHVQVGVVGVGRKRADGADQIARQFAHRRIGTHRGLRHCVGRTARDLLQRGASAERAHLRLERRRLSGRQPDRRRVAFKHGDVGLGILRKISLICRTRRHRANFRRDRGSWGGGEGRKCAGHLRSE